MNFWPSVMAAGQPKSSKRQVALNPEDPYLHATVGTVVDGITEDGLSEGSVVQLLPAE